MIVFEKSFEWNNYKPFDDYNHRAMYLVSLQYKKIIIYLNKICIFFLFDTLSLTLLTKAAQYKDNRFLFLIIFMY